MMLGMRFALIAVLFALVLTAAASGATTFPRGTAVLDDGEHRVSVAVELATTSDQQARGLMFRTKLAPDAGMAFLFGRPVTGGFWMKNTRIPLSIAFWNARGRIVRILDMTPCRADPCPVYKPGLSYVGALEVNRGAFRRWSITRGDTLTIRRR
jgi:uncharacterized membrane protein (UPF0127 family)